MEKHSSGKKQVDLNSKLKSQVSERKKKYEASKTATIHKGNTK